MGACQSKWQPLEKVKLHLHIAHDVEPSEAKEGDDYFFDRSYNRENRVHGTRALAYLEDGLDLEERIRYFQLLLTKWAGLGMDYSDDEEDMWPFPFGMFGLDDDSDEFTSDGYF